MAFHQLPCFCSCRHRWESRRALTQAPGLRRVLAALGSGKAPSLCWVGVGAGGAPFPCRPTVEQKTETWPSERLLRGEQVGRQAGRKGAKDAVGNVYKALTFNALFSKP